MPTTTAPEFIDDIETAAAHATFEQLTAKREREGLTLEEVCHATEAGYNAEHSMYDAGMIELAEAMTSSAGELRRAVLALELLPELAQALQKLLTHALHYAAMPHAHSDAHRDAANARAAIAKAREAGLIA